MSSARTGILALLVAAAALLAGAAPAVAAGPLEMVAQVADVSWTASAITSGSTALASAPAPIVDPATGQLCVVATLSAPAGDVVEFCRVNGQWLEFDLTRASGGAAAAGEVAPIVDPASDETVLFYRDAAGELWVNTRAASGAWSAQNITGTGAGLSAISSDPHPVVDPQTGQLCVVATLSAPAGDVVEFCRVNGQWLQFDLTHSWGGPAAAGGVAPIVDPAHNETDVFYDDGAGRLWALARQASGQWVAADVTVGTTAPALTSDPRPIVDPATGALAVFAEARPTAAPASPPATVTTPVPRGRSAIRARFVIGWRWDSRGTVLRTIRVRGLPRKARVAVRCVGRHCPRVRGSAAGSRRIRRLLARLIGRRFAPGDALRITVTAPRRQTERLELRIRRQRPPLGRLLSR